MDKNQNKPTHLVELDGEIIDLCKAGYWLNEKEIRALQADQRRLNESESAYWKKYFEELRKKENSEK